MKFVLPELFNLEISHCVTIVKFFIDGALAHLFLKGLCGKLGTFLLEAGDGPPDLWSTFSSLGLEWNSPLLCQHQTASTYRDKNEPDFLQCILFLLWQSKQTLCSGLLLKNYPSGWQERKIPTIILTTRSWQALVWKFSVIQQFVCQWLEGRMQDPRGIIALIVVGVPVPSTKVLLVYLNYGTLHLSWILCTQSFKLAISKQGTWPPC